MKDPGIKLTIDTTDLDKTIEKVDLLIEKLKIAEQLSKSVNVKR